MADVLAALQQANRDGSLRTLAGVSMDIGMSLLIVNLMITALKRSDDAIGFRSQGPGPEGLAAMPVAEPAK